MILVDTGFWLALASAKDRHHQRSVECLQALEEPLITTWPVVTETCHLLLKRIGEPAQRRFLSSHVEGGFDIFGLERKDGPRVLELMKQYADLPMDLADASLVILAEHLGHGRILSTDRRDFHSYRWKSRHPFENLLLD